jgi:DNA mismatch repair ATPase MutS
MVKILFNVEYLMFYSFLEAISKERKNIEKLFVFIGEIDAAISTASLKSSNLKICTPTFNDTNELNVTEIYHPLIDNCIDNNLHLAKKSMLLTGSNMSGKTTFIRTVAINSILAQTLHFCFADVYSAPYYKVYSSIRITDDLLDNTSYYLQEVLNIKELIDTSNDTNPCLFVLDEIFKGTNTVERISGGKAILSYLNKEQHTVFVSTHDIELTELLQKENYELFHFSEQIENNKLFFDHKIKKGKLKTRNAIKILELYKYPSEIIRDAKNIEALFK